MKKIVPASFTVALFLALSFTGAGNPSPDRAAGWEPIGPNGGRMNALAANPADIDEVFALAASVPGRLFRTADGGKSWSKAAVLSMYAQDATVCPAAPDVLYAVSYDRLHKSKDRGTTWTEWSFRCKSFYPRGRIAVDSKNPKKVYIAGRSGGWMAVLSSSDEGRHWTLATLSQDSSNYNGNACDIVSSPSHPQVLYMGGYATVFGVSNLRIFKSSDRGKTWRNVTGDILQAGNAARALAVDPKNPERVFAGTDKGIYRSLSGGTTWQEVKGSAKSIAALSFDRTDSRVLYAGTGMYGTGPLACYKSSDGGSTWNNVAKSIGGGWITRIAAEGAKAFVSTNAGVYRSLNGGASWRASNTGIVASDITTMAVAPASPAVVFAEVQSIAFFKTLDGGKRWNRMPYFYRCESISRFAVHPADAKKVFILAGG